MSEAPNVKPGDEVSWQWSGGAPGGVASEVKADEVKMTTKRGNEVTKKGTEENPAVKVDREGHDVVKKASELEIEEEGPNHKDDGEKGKSAEADGKQDTPAEKTEEKKETKSRGRPKKSETPKPKAAEKPKADAKTGAKTNGEKAEPKSKKGRKPAGEKSAAQKKKEEKPKKRAATETGEPRRSKRVKN